MKDFVLNLGPRVCIKPANNPTIPTLLRKAPTLKTGRAYPYKYLKDDGQTMFFFSQRSSTLIY